MLQPDVEKNLADYVGVVRRQKTVLALVTLLALGLGAAFTSFQTRYYSATTEIMVELEPTTDLTGASAAGRSDSARQLENEVGFLESSIVVDVVAGQLGFEPEIAISSETNSDFISIRATESTPEAALRAATVYADTYLTVRRELAVSEFAITAGVVQQQIAELDKLLAEIDNSDAPLSEIEERRVPIVAQRAVYEQGLSTIQLNADLTSGAVGRVVSPAELPTAPSSPRAGRNLLLSLLAGLLAAAGAAILRDSLADVVVGRDGAQQLIGTRPVLGEVPRYKVGDRRTVLETDFNSVAAESYRTVRTSIAFALLQSDRRVVQVTSSTMGEGKSEMVANLAVALARGGARVIAIDADLRRPTLAARFGLDPDVAGLSSAIAREVKLRDAIFACPGLPNLSIMPSGPMPADPTAFLESPLLRLAIEKLADHYDYVLFDTPPVGIVSDPLTISTLVDGVVLVARHNETSRTELAQTIDSLERLDAPVMGLILNGVDGGRGYRRGYYSRPGRVIDHRINIADSAPAPSQGTPTGGPAAVEWSTTAKPAELAEQAKSAKTAEPAIDLAEKPSPNH